MANPRSGRPEKLNVDSIGAQMEAMAALGIGELKKVAYVFGVTPETMSRYAKKYPHIITAFQRGKERGALKLKRTAWNLALAGHWPALKYCLENLTEWQDKAQPQGGERTQVIVYLPAVENDPTKPPIIIEPTNSGGSNGNGKHHKELPLEAPPRPTD